jgi:hypothetical protein
MNFIDLTTEAEMQDAKQWLAETHKEGYGCKGDACRKIIKSGR